jgi:ADP-ribose pyrophosphatase YjhB (NUDIX family)
MYHLPKITDADVFSNKNMGQPTEWTLRKTVKIIIKNSENKIALVTNPKHKCFLLPGGGIHEDEEILYAANRESEEEAFCSIKNAKVIGVIEELRSRDGQKYETYAVFASKDKDIKEDKRTDEEKENSLTVIWLTPNEAAEKFKQQEILLREGKINFYHTGFNIVRDSAFFKSALAKNLL